MNIFSLSVWSTFSNSFVLAKSCLLTSGVLSKKRRFKKLVYRAWTLVTSIWSFFNIVFMPLHIIRSFQLRVSLVNLTKSVRNCGFGHIYWRNPGSKTSFICSVQHINIVFFIVFIVNLNRSNRSHTFWKSGISKNFLIFIGEQLRLSFFFNKVAYLSGEPLVWKD